MIIFHHGNLKDYLLKVSKPPTTSDNSLTSALSYYGTKARVKFTVNLLKFHTLMEK